MSADIIDGKAIAGEIRARLAKHVERVVERGLLPSLAVVLVGDNAASQVYVRNKVKQTETVGMHSLQFRLPADISEAELLKKVAELNDDASVHGILVQLPLSPHIDENKVIQAISPHKDVDGFHLLNVGLLATGSRDGFVPCTPYGCLHLLRRQLGDLSGKHAVVIGRSNIVGKPMGQLLLQAHCTVTIAHSRTRDLASLARQGDILVAALGRAETITSEFIKPGATVIDVGINEIQVGDKKRLVGDVDFAAASSIAAAITPVPGGVGPMTIAMLLRNTYLAACRQAGHDFAKLADFDDIA